MFGIADVELLADVGKLDCSDSEAAVVCALGCAMRVKTARVTSQLDIKDLRTCMSMLCLT